MKFYQVSQWSSNGCDSVRDASRSEIIDAAVEPDLMASACDDADEDENGMAKIIYSDGWIEIKAYPETPGTEAPEKTKGIFQTIGSYAVVLAIVMAFVIGMINASNKFDSSSTSEAPISSSAAPQDECTQGGYYDADHKFHINSEVEDAFACASTP